MSRRDARSTFTALRTEGGLLPADLLARIAAGDARLFGLTPEDYGLDRTERLGDAINRSWARLTGLWAAFQDARQKLPETDRGTTLTRERWLLHLFNELGYGRLTTKPAIEVDGHSFPISHGYRSSPIHLLGCRIDLERSQRGVAGASSSSPHGLLQDCLNRSNAHLWGFVSNGLALRILRDHHSLTRLAYVEFDLEAIFGGQLFAEFRVLWLLCHESRVVPRATRAAGDGESGEETPEGCWLEAWFKAARDDGVRALDKLRDGVQKALACLGTGFLRARGNRALQDALATGKLSTQDYYRQLLRLAYRLIFLFVAEDRGVLLDPAATPEARLRFERFYSTARIRRLADRRRGGPHPDLWQALRLTMDQLDNGYPDLAMPALGSFLWSRGACADLLAAELPNEALLDALRAMCTLQDGNVRRPVSWALIASDELGSVYESLMELHPRVNREAGTFELVTAAGHERKTTGSYYTPSSLVDCLLDSALDPVLAEAAAAPNPEKAILDLKVCDPACGSGHFLVAAARRIAVRLARVRSGDAEPSPGAVGTALRDVVGRCLFGVDLNPMAVELCKVSLWMEALEPGRPLSFLDAHIQHGNAVFGTTAELMAGGLPDEAFTALKGEDKDVAGRLKKANKNWRQPGLFSAAALAPERTVAAVSARVEAAGDDTRAAVALKEAAWRALAESPEASHARLVADLWCAAFVWPKGSPAAEDAAPVRAVWEAAKENPASVPPETLAIATDLATRFGFFHWDLAFPQVMARGGFDVLLGNPPWETLSPDRREFFGQFRPGMRSLSPEEQEAAIAELSDSTDLGAAWEAHCLDLFRLVHFLKNSGRFTLFAPGNLGKGDFNIYRMFTELALRAVRTGGFAAQVLPAGLRGGANMSAVRQHLFDAMTLEVLVSCINTGQVFFPGVHAQTQIVIYAARRGGRTDQFHAAFGVTDPALLGDIRRRSLSIPADAIRKAAPDTYAIPDVRTVTDITVSAKMNGAHPAFGDDQVGPPWRHYLRELDMGTDNNRFTTDLAGLPLYEGRMVAHFDHRAKTYESGHGNNSVWTERPFGDPKKAIVPQWRVLEGRLPAKLGDRTARYRLVFRDVAQPSDMRSLIATFVPPGCVCGDTVPTILAQRGSEWQYLPWLAVANTFAMDWLTRQKLSSPHLKFFIVDTLPFPRPALTDPWVQRVAPLVLRLVCTGPEMTAYWNQMAEHDLCAPVPEDTVPPDAFVTEADRERARVELDVIVARDVYGITAAEMADILDTFPVVRRRDEAAHGEFRTKRLILEGFETVAVPTAVAPASVSENALAPSAPDSLDEFWAARPGHWAVANTDPATVAVTCAVALAAALPGPVARSDFDIALAVARRPELLLPFLDDESARRWVAVTGAIDGDLPSNVVSLRDRCQAADTAGAEAMTKVERTWGLIRTLPDDRIEPTAAAATAPTQADWAIGRVGFALAALPLIRDAQSGGQLLSLGGRRHADSPAVTRTRA
jgi:hypothetical protein